MNQTENRQKAWGPGRDNMREYFVNPETFKDVHNMLLAHGVGDYAEWLSFEEDRDGSLDDCRCSVSYDRGNCEGWIVRVDRFSTRYSGAQMENVIMAKMFDPDVAELVSNMIMRYIHNRPFVSVLF